MSSRDKNRAMFVTYASYTGRPLVSSPSVVYFVVPLAPLRRRTRIMVRDLSIGLLLALALTACGGDPSTPGERPRAEAEGTVSVALTADNGGVTYRLSKATFVITGPTLANPLVVKPPADTPIDT